MPSRQDLELDGKGAISAFEKRGLGGSTAWGGIPPPTWIRFKDMGVSAPVLHTEDHRRKYQNGVCTGVCVSMSGDFAQQPTHSPVSAVIDMPIVCRHAL